jgi:hypothetical protein
MSGDDIPGLDRSLGAGQRSTGPENRGTNERRPPSAPRRLYPAERSDQMDVYDFVSEPGPLFSEGTVRTEKYSFSPIGPNQRATPDAPKIAPVAPKPASPASTPASRPSPDNHTTKPSAGAKSVPRRTSQNPIPTPKSQSTRRSTPVDPAATRNRLGPATPDQYPNSATKPSAGAKSIPRRTSTPKSQSTRRSTPVDPGATRNRLGSPTPDQNRNSTPDQRREDEKIEGRVPRTMEEAAEAIRETWKWDDQKFAQKARNFYYKQFQAAYIKEADKSANLANSAMFAELTIPWILAAGWLAAGWTAAEIFYFLEEAGMGANAALRVLLQTGSLKTAAFTAAQYPALVASGVGVIESAAGDTGTSLDWPAGTVINMESRAIDPASRATVAQLYGRSGEEAMVELEKRGLSKADKLMLEKIVELGRSKSGSRLLTYKGAYYSVPEGVSPTRLPKSDPLGDEMLHEVQKIADRFDAAKHLTEEQKRSLFNASPSDRGGRMVAFKGSWVHKKMEAQFWDLPWSTKGIDAIGPHISYEVMTWTETGVVTHLGRVGGMDNDIWRAIFYTEGRGGMAKYLKQLGL